MRGYHTGRGTQYRERPLAGSPHHGGSGYPSTQDGVRVSCNPRRGIWVPFYPRCRDIVVILIALLLLHRALTGDHRDRGVLLPKTEVVVILIAALPAAFEASPSRSSLDGRYTNARPPNIYITRKARIVMHRYLIGRPKITL